MKFKKPFTFYLGNTLILLSFVCFTFIFYPLIEAYFFPDKLTTPPPKGLFIQIPKIKAQSIIVPNVDPWNESVYSGVLKKGVAHAEGTSLPGDKGTAFVFAHSSGPPWELTRSNTVFLRLGELTPGDTIYIYRDGKKLTFRVFVKKEVWPSEVSYLTHEQGTQLVIQTCWPIGTDLKRLLVFAKQV